jgi:hypothetical protein
LGGALGLHHLTTVIAQFQRTSRGKGDRLQVVEPEILAVLNQQGLPIVVCEPAVSFLMRAATAADEDCNNRGVYLSVEFAGLESRAWLVGEVWVIAGARFYPPLSHVRIVAPGELLGEVKRSFPDVGPTPFEYGARAEYPFDLLAVAPSLVVLKHREGERIEHDMQVRGCRPKVCWNLSGAISGKVEFI